MKSILIGEQEWMIENLNVDSYQNGDSIPEVQNAQEWESIKTGAWCYYDNDLLIGKKYGRLYNWHAVHDPRGLAPKGWHIPKKEELDILKVKTNDDGNALKELGQGTDKGAGTNITGFSALLAGLRSFNSNFYFLGQYVYLWSSSENSESNADSITLSHNDRSIIFHSSTKECGLNVRCLKD